MGNARHDCQSHLGVHSGQLHFDIEVSNAARFWVPAFAGTTVAECYRGISRQAEPQLALNAIALGVHLHSWTPSH